VSRSVSHLISAKGSCLKCKLKLIHISEVIHQRRSLLAKFLVKQRKLPLLSQ